MFELKVRSFSTSRSICRQLRDCRIFFRMCLKHSQSVIDPEPPCTYGNASTDALGADPDSISESAPMKVDVSFKWPVSDQNQNQKFGRRRALTCLDDLITPAVRSSVRVSELRGYYDY